MSKKDITFRHLKNNTIVQFQIAAGIIALSLLLLNGYSIFSLPVLFSLPALFVQVFLFFLFFPVLSPQTIQGDYFSIKIVALSFVPLIPLIYTLLFLGIYDRVDVDSSYEEIITSTQSNESVFDFRSEVRYGEAPVHVKASVEQHFSEKFYHVTEYALDTLFEYEELDDVH